MRASGTLQSSKVCPKDQALFLPCHKCKCKVYYALRIGKEFLDSLQKIKIGLGKVGQGVGITVPLRKSFSFNGCSNVEKEITSQVLISEEQLNE